MEGQSEGRLKGWSGDRQFHSFRGRAGGTVRAGRAIGPSTYSLRNIRGVSGGRLKGQLEGQSEGQLEGRLE